MCIFFNKSIINKLFHYWKIFHLLNAFNYPILPYTLTRKLHIVRFVKERIPFIVS